MTFLHVIISIWYYYMVKKINFLLHSYLFFVFHLSFKHTYQQTTYQNRGNYLNALTFDNIISVLFWNERKHEYTRFLFFISVRPVQKYLSTIYILKQRKPLGLHFFKTRATWTHKVPTFHICNMSSKSFLRKPNAKQMKLRGCWCHTF